MALAGNNSSQRLVKSYERVRDLGEVFTPDAIVQAMLDLLPESMWEVHPAPTFFEPACGDGNFLVAILDRKLKRIAKRHAEGRLPSGTSSDAARFHALEALASIYAVDISADNVLGGRPEHEVGARTRLLAMLVEWSANNLGERLTARTAVYRAAEWIVEHNIVIGNMLPLDAVGRSTGRDTLPLIEYAFDPATQSVSVARTKIDDIIAAEEEAAATIPSLFGPPQPQLLWEGKAANLAEVTRVAAPELRGPVRNGARKRR